MANLSRRDYAGPPTTVDTVLEIKEKPHRGIGYFEKEDPRSLINIVPSYVAQSMARIPPEFLDLSEKELEDKLHNAKKLTPELRMMRVAWWYEYDRAQVMMRKMNMTNVFGGVCAISYFNKKVVPDPLQLAYLITPVAEYELTIKELLLYGLGQLRDILMLPHVDEEGNPNPKMADVKRKIVEDLMTRDRGSVVHKIESKNLHMNVDMQMPDVTDINDVNRQIAELEGQLEDEVIDVKPGE